MLLDHQSRSSAGLATLAAVLVLSSGAFAQDQDLADADVSGCWSVTLTPADDLTASLTAPFKDKLKVFLSRVGNQITGTTMDKFGACGQVLNPLVGEQDGAAFTMDQDGTAPDPADCTQSGTISLVFDALLGDNAHALAACTGSVHIGILDAALSFSATLKRVSGMQSPTDPDGDGPGVAVDQIGQDSDTGAHDLAITRIKAVKSVQMKSHLMGIQREVTVTIQNRGQHTEIVQDAATLQSLVTLQVDKVGGEQGTVLMELRLPVSKTFPLKLAPRKKMKLGYLVTFLPTDDPPGSGDLEPGIFAWSASIDHAVLPGAIPDDHPFDDVAPRSVLAPFTYDAYPDGKIKERGVGAPKPDGTLGAPVLTTYKVVNG